MDDELVYRCICHDDQAGGSVIECDSCRLWSHAECYEIDLDDQPAEITFVCSSCLDTSKYLQRRLNQSQAKDSASSSDPMLLPPNAFFCVRDCDVVSDSLRTHIQSWSDLRPVCEQDLKTQPYSVVSIPTPQPSPQLFCVKSGKALPPDGFVGMITAEIVPLSSYLSSPLNKYMETGLPRAFVHLIGKPYDVALDSRGCGSMSRYIRSGCYPNARIEPVRLLEGDTVAFAVFTTKNIRAKEEIVLPWEWDDGHLVHGLESLWSKPLLECYHERMQATTIVTVLQDSFMSCPCSPRDVGECVLSMLAAFALRGPSNPIGSSIKPPLAGIERGLRAVPCSDGPQKGARLDRQSDTVELSPPSCSIIPKRRPRLPVLLPQPHVPPPPPLVRAASPSPSPSSHTPSLITPVDPVGHHDVVIRLPEDLSSDVSSIRQAAVYDPQHLQKTSVDDESCLPPRMRKKWMKSRRNLQHSEASVQSASRPTGQRVDLPSPRPDHGTPDVIMKEEESDPLSLLVRMLAHSNIPPLMTSASNDIGDASASQASTAVTQGVKEEIADNVATLLLPRKTEVQDSRPGSGSGTNTGNECNRSVTVSKDDTMMLDIGCNVWNPPEKSSGSLGEHEYRSGECSVKTADQNVNPTTEAAVVTSSRPTSISFQRSDDADGVNSIELPVVSDDQQASPETSNESCELEMSPALITPAEESSPPLLQASKSLLIFQQPSTTLPELSRSNSGTVARNNGVETPLQSFTPFSSPRSPRKRKRRNPVGVVFNPTGGNAISAVEIKTEEESYSLSDGHAPFVPCTLSGHLTKTPRLQELTKSLGSDATASCQVASNSDGASHETNIAVQANRVKVEDDPSSALLVVQPIDHKASNKWARSFTPVLVGSSIPSTPAELQERQTKLPVKPPAPSAVPSSVLAPLLPSSGGPNKKMSGRQRETSNDVPPRGGSIKKRSEPSGSEIRQQSNSGKDARRDIRSLMREGGLVAVAQTLSRQPNKPKTNPGIPSGLFSYSI